MRIGLTTKVGRASVAVMVTKTITTSAANYRRDRANTDQSRRAIIPLNATLQSVNTWVSRLVGSGAQSIRKAPTTTTNAAVILRIFHRLQQRPQRQLLALPVRIRSQIVFLPCWAFPTKCLSLCNNRRNRNGNQLRLPPLSIVANKIFRRPATYRPTLSHKGRRS